MKDLHKIFCKKETSTKKAAKKSVELLEKVVFANETKQIVYPILKGAGVKILKILVNTLAKKWGIGNSKLNTNAPRFLKLKPILPYSETELRPKSLDYRNPFEP